MLTYILCPRSHGCSLVNTYCNGFPVLADMGGFCQPVLRFILCTHRHVIGLVNTYGETFCVLTSMGSFWSVHVEMHFVSSLAWDGYVPCMFRYFFVHRYLATNVDMHFPRDMANILCNDRHAMGLVNTC